MPTAYVYHEICKSLNKKVLKHMSLSKLLWSTYQVKAVNIHTIHLTKLSWVSKKGLNINKGLRENRHRLSLQFSLLCLNRTPKLSHSYRRLLLSFIACAVLGTSVYVKNQLPRIRLAQCWECHLHENNCCSTLVVTNRLAVRRAPT